MLSKLRKIGLAALIGVMAMAPAIDNASAAIQLSTRVRNAMLDAIATIIGGSAHIQIWTGTQPASCATTEVGTGNTKLADFGLAATWTNAASGGSKTLTAVTGTTGLAAGNAGHYRLTDTNDLSTSCDEQGTITATGGGGDMTIDNVSIAVGQTVNITSWSWTEPGA
jgi:hypothetical protein